MTQNGRSLSGVSSRLARILPSGANIEIEIGLDFNDFN